MSFDFPNEWKYNNGLLMFSRQHMVILVKVWFEFHNFQKKQRATGNVGNPTAMRNFFDRKQLIVHQD